MVKRIFFTQSYGWIAYLIISFNVAWMLQNILTGILICRPVAMNWDPTARGQCGNQTLAFAAVGIVDIVTDMAIIILPFEWLQVCSKNFQRITESQENLRW